VSDPLLALATFGVSLVGGFVPLVNVELYLVGVATAVPHAGLVPIVLAASLGQVAAKCVLYGAGTRVLRVSPGRSRALVAGVARLRAAHSGGRALVFSSALFGLPPFYVMSLAAGALRLGLPVFVALGLTGRVLRFAAVFLVPRLLV
jgi:membrane protein YqaA with SNARE-associated domain